jgi:hypothetical protein
MRSRLASASRASASLPCSRSSRAAATTTRRVHQQPERQQYRLRRCGLPAGFAEQRRPLQRNHQRRCPLERRSLLPGRLAHHAELTLNLGLRWEYFQPYQDVGGYQASYNMTGAPPQHDHRLWQRIGAVSDSHRGQELCRSRSSRKPTTASPTFLPKDNMALVYTGDPHIIKAQKTNFAPRVGIAYSPDSKTPFAQVTASSTAVWRAPVTIPNLGENYPFQYEGRLPADAEPSTAPPTASPSPTASPTSWPTALPAT